MILEIFASILIVSLVSLIGVFTLGMQAKKLKKYLMLLVSFSVGVLFGDAFIHLLPEAFKKMGFGLETSFSVLFGIMMFFVLEKIIKWHHHHNVEDHEIHSFGYVNLVADMLHNFMDGLLIAGTYIASIPLGIATTIAVLFHEIPQEIGDFGVLVQSGFTPKQALKVNFLSALTAMVGGAVGIIFATQVQPFSQFIIPITAGCFIYIAGTDLLPEVHKQFETKEIILQFIAIVLGMLIMAALLFVAE